LHQPNPVIIERQTDEGGDRSRMSGQTDHVSNDPLYFLAWTPNRPMIDNLLEPLRSTSWIVVSVAMVCFVSPAGLAQQPSGEGTLMWSELPPLPDKLGVAGPFAGVHHDALIVAGGANFPQPVWQHEKQWHDSIYVLTRGAAGDYVWKEGGKLPRKIAYGAAVSTSQGVVCIGGNDSQTTFGDVFLLSYDPQTQRVTRASLPSLPSPRAFAAATLLGDRVFIVGGQSEASLETATGDLWSLDLSRRGDASFGWETHERLPGPARALHITATGYNGTHDAIYVISGRRQRGEQTEFLKDVWEYVPANEQWRQRSDAPRCVMAGPGIGFGRRRILVLGGADGSLFHRSDELRDAHPGFPKQALVYHTIANRWSTAGTTPANHVTTIAVNWNGSVVIPSGEVRPRVRSARVWKVEPAAGRSDSEPTR
jgi:SSS family solute:Na+ symporter